MSELRTNRIIPRDGLTSGTGIAGGIIQMKTNYITAAFTTQSTTYTDITGHNVTITPTRADSKILIDYRVNWMHTASNDAVGTLRLFRGSTLIGNDSNNPMSDDRMGILQLYNGSQAHMSQSSFTFLDSPSTTSATTYKMQIHLDTGSYSGSHIFSINHWPPNDNYRGTSSITAYEVSG